ncbi:MAG: ABC transporter ATP-binding protein [Candidatus Wallbacteria bacterium]|nr:ABC transporter ATP-binding protein [Candidatus Wallbacteria bacterium]
MSVYVRRLIRYGRPYLGKAVASSLMAMVVAAGNAAPAYFLKLLVDDVLASEKGRKFLLPFALFIFTSMLVKGVFYFGQIYYASYVSNGMIKDLRQDIFQQLINYSLGFYYKHPLGQVMSRFTSDALLLQGIIQSLVSVVSDSVTIVFLIGYIFYVNFRLALVSLIVLPPIVYVITKFSKKIRRLSYQQQDKIGDITAHLQESFSAVKEIKAFLMEKERVEGFSRINDDSFVINLKNNRLVAMVLPVVELFNTLAISSVMMYGGWLVLNGVMTKGDLFSFLAALGILFTPMKRLTTVNNYLQQADGAARRIYEYLDAIAEREVIDGEINQFSIQGRLEFKDVFFSYETGKEVLRGISFTARPGEVIALVGRSGAGKTTIINLIPRFFKIDRGSIMIDGTDISCFSLPCLRSIIGMVPQETFIFKGTILENILMGTQSGMEKVTEVAKAANAHDFIMQLPNGYYTEISERGTNLSGGQRQRIAIARLILKSPGILLLDEATSSLDCESEKLIQEALERLTKGRTTFVIAHRLSTVINADRILVIDEGKIAEEGSHATLMQQKGIYYNLYQTQHAFASPETVIGNA